MQQPVSLPTVLGPISPDSLGWVLPHEHVVTSSAGIWDSYPELIGDTASRETEAVSALSALLGTPFHTIVDLTTHDLGRNIRFLKRVSLDSGISIIAATGCWLDAPRSFYRRSPHEVAGLFVRELREGIEDSGIRAGVIKVASEGPISPEFQVIFRAAAIASAETGAPIYTHSSMASRDGLEQLALLLDSGAQANRICIGHSNDTADLPYLLELAEAGCFIGLDRFPGDHGITLQERIELISTLVKAGHGQRILLSHDWAVEYSHSIQPRHGRERNPDGYRLINDVIIPELRQSGVTESELSLMCATNPRTFLTGEAAR